MTKVPPIMALVCAAMVCTTFHMSWASIPSKNTLDSSQTGFDHSIVYSMLVGGSNFYRLSINTFCIFWCLKYLVN